MNSSSVIDWNLARSVAHRIGGKGPTIGREGARQAVEELRAGAATAVHVVRDITELKADANADTVRVVDRSRWVDANAAAFASVLDVSVAPPWAVVSFLLFFIKQLNHHANNRGQMTDLRAV